MPGRVLNFSEFFSKYSKDGENNQKSTADLSKASDAFQDAFDENSYKQDNLGPNRPVASVEGITPAQPGEVGAPKFATNSQAPSPEEAPETPEQEKAEHPEEEESEEEKKKDEEEETPEPEANESLKQLKGFTDYIKEDYDFENSEDNDEDDENEVICQSCGEHKRLDGETPEKDSWFNESTGMMCENCK